jgi:hypothetical protein
VGSSRASTLSWVFSFLIGLTPGNLSDEMTILIGTSSLRASNRLQGRNRRRANERPFHQRVNHDDKTIFDGKESAGLSIKGHAAQKDGILARLLAAEAAIDDCRRASSKSPEWSKVYLRGRLLMAVAPKGNAAARPRLR